MVTQIITATGQIGAARQGQVLNVCRQLVADRRYDAICAAAFIFDDQVTRRLHLIGVITGSTSHGVGSAAAIDEVATGITLDVVGQSVASTAGIPATGQLQVLNVFCQRIADRRAHAVRAFLEGLCNLIATVVDHIKVITQRADERVRTHTTIERIVARACFETVGNIGANQHVRIA